MTLSLKTKHVLLFDLDGTLVDSAPDLALAINRTLNDLNLEKCEQTTIRGWVGNGAKTLVERALSQSATIDEKLDPVLAKDALSRFLSHYQVCLCEESVLYNDVKEGLFSLKASGFRLAIVTNKPAAFIEPILTGLGLTGLFEILVGGDTLPQRKPDPAQLHYAMTQLGVSAEQCIMIGDSKNDILAAKAANMDCAALTYGYNYGEDISQYQPKWCVDTFSELLEILKK
jgi:phosphoglycolate phosphatase